MKKKVVSVLLTLAMATTMLAGCGDKKTADSELGENYESSSAQQSEESQEESSDTAEESSEGSSAEPGGQPGSWTIPSM